MTTTTGEIKTIHSNTARPMIKPCARNGFENRLSKIFNHSIGKPIAQPIVRINNKLFSFVRTACQSVRHYSFYSSLRTAKQTIRTANQTVQIIYSPVRTVCLSVRNFYSSVRTADQTVQIIYSPVRTVTQTVRTLQGPFFNRSFLQLKRFFVSVRFAFHGHKSSRHKSWGH